MLSPVRFAALRVDLRLLFGVLLGFGAVPRQDDEALLQRLAQGSNAPAPVPAEERIQFGLYDRLGDGFFAFEAAEECPFAEAKKSSCSSSLMAVASSSHFSSSGRL